MIRNILTIGIFGLLGLIALNLVFGILHFAVGLFVWLVIVAAKIALGLGAVYLVIRIVSPSTARKLRGQSG